MADGIDVGLDLDYPIGEVLNETGSTASVLSTFVGGQPIGSFGFPYTTTDWMGGSAGTPQRRTHRPVGLRDSPDVGGDPLFYQVFKQGTYSSTSGYDVYIPFSFEWDGVSVGTSYFRPGHRDRDYYSRDHCNLHGLWVRES